MPMTEKFRRLLQLPGYFPRVTDEQLAATVKAVSPQPLESPLPPLVERTAMAMAIGNNGGEWDAHYTEEQKALWRERAARVIEEIADELQPDYYYGEDE